jgi:hypothetical protein
LVCLPVFLAAVLAQAAPAAAQLLPWEDRFFLNVSVGGQNGVQDIDQTLQFELHTEQAGVAATHRIGNGISGDVTGGMRVLDNLAIGVGYSRFSRKYGVVVNALLPHPLFTGDPRSVTEVVNDVIHTENAVHVQAAYMVPLSDRIELAVLGGPTFYSLKQELVTGINLAPEAPPYIPEVTGIPLAEASGSAVGYNVGADWTYLLKPVPSGSRPAIGVGVLVRYSRASIDLDAEGASTRSQDLGGLLLGAGLRFRWR